MKDILNRRSALHWFNLLEVFLLHKTPKSFCRFCGNFPGYIQNPVWSSPLNQAGPHCPALRFAWPGSRGRPQGTLLWLCHLLPCLSTAQPPSRFTKAPSLSCHLETPSLWHLAQFQFCPKLLQQADKENPSHSTEADLQHYQGSTVEENLTLKMYKNQHLLAVRFFFLLHSAGKMRIEKTTSEQKMNPVKQQHDYKTLISLLAQVLWYYLVRCQSMSGWETVSQALKLVSVCSLQDVRRVEVLVSWFHPLSRQFWGSHRVTQSFPQSLPEPCSCPDIVRFYSTDLASAFSEIWG